MKNENTSSSSVNSGGGFSEPGFQNCAIAKGTETEAAWNNWLEEEFKLVLLSPSSSLGLSFRVKKTLVVDTLPFLYYTMASIT